MKHHTLQQEENVMSRRVRMIGLLVMSAVMMLVTDANAQFFDGWGWFGFSAVHGVIDLRGVPNPDTKPSFVQIKLTLKSIAIVCKNPNNSTTPASPGSAGDRTVTLGQPITLANFTGDPGQAQVTFDVDLSFAEVDTNCVNPNWTHITGSAAVGLILAEMKSYRCTNKELDGIPDADPCFEGMTLTATLRDTVNLECTLNPVLRDSNFIPLHDQDFTCVEK
jgi:hypothetical protein